MEDLKLWHKVNALATEAYKAMGNFPKEERDGLTSHISVAATFVPSNIARGVEKMLILISVIFLTSRMAFL